MKVEITWTEEVEYVSTITIDEDDFRTWCSGETGDGLLAEYLRSGVDEEEDWHAPASDGRDKRSTWADFALVSARTVNS